MNTPNPIHSTGRLFLASLALAAACTTLHAADTTPTPAPLPTPQATATPFAMTPELRDKFKAAYVQASQDAKVLAAEGAAKDAWNAYRGLVKKKILAADPSLQPLYDKADKAAAAKAAGAPADPLTAGEEQTMQDAFTKLGSDPEIKDALGKFIVARNTTSTLIRATIVKTDPSLEPVLEAIDKARAQQQAAAAAAAGQGAQ